MKNIVFHQSSQTFGQGALILKRQFEIQYRGAKKWFIAQSNCFKAWSYLIYFGIILGKRNGEKICCILIPGGREVEFKMKQLSFLTLSLV